MTDSAPGKDPTPPEDVVVFDLKQALRVTGDDREILIEIIQVYLEDLPNMMGAVRAALDSGDVSAVELHAHSLKGASANVGGQRVRAVAQGMEKAANLKSLEEARALFPALEIEAARFAEYLSGLDPASL